MPVPQDDAEFQIGFNPLRSGIQSSEHAHGTVRLYINALKSSLIFSTFPYKIWNAGARDTIGDNESALFDEKNSNTRY